MSSQSSVFARNKQTAWQNVQDKVVCVSPKTKKIHILYGSGGSVWTYLKEPKDFDQLVALMCEEYDTTPDTAKSDLEPFLEKLKKEQLVVEQ